MKKAFFGLFMFLSVILLSCSQPTGGTTTTTTTTETPYIVGTWKRTYTECCQYYYTDDGVLTYRVYVGEDNPGTIYPLTNEYVQNRFDYAKEMCKEAYLAGETQNVYIYIDYGQCQTITFYSDGTYKTDFLPSGGYTYPEYYTTYEYTGKWEISKMVDNTALMYCPTDKSSYGYMILKHFDENTLIVDFSLGSWEYQKVTE